MNCDCKPRIEDDLTRKFAEKTPQGANHCVELQGYALGMTPDSGVVMVAAGEAVLQAEHPKKGGGTRVVNQRQRILFKFCPFCGKSVNP